MSMRRTLGVVLGILLVATAANAQAKPDFSGTWKFDAAHSDQQMSPPGMQLPPDPQQLVITQSAGELTIDDGTKSTFKLDGSDSTNSMHGIPVVTRTAWEGASLVTRGTVTAPNMTVDYSDTRVLSADGHTMTVTHHGKIANLGEATRKLVFTK